MPQRGHAASATLSTVALDGRRQTATAPPSATIQRSSTTFLRLAASMAVHSTIGSLQEILSSLAPFLVLFCRGAFCAPPPNQKTGTPTGVPRFGQSPIAHKKKINSAGVPMTEKCRLEIRGEKKEDELSLGSVWVFFRKQRPTTVRASTRQPTAIFSPLSTASGVTLEHTFYPFWGGQRCVVQQHATYQKFWTFVFAILSAHQHWGTCALHVFWVFCPCPCISRREKFGVAVALSPSFS